MDEGHQRETLAFLRETLGLTVEGDLDPTGYTKMAQGALEKRLVFTLNYDNGWNDLDDWVYPYFHSQGYKNSFNLSDPDLDAMLEAQRAEFDYDRRHEIGLDIQHYLLDNVLARLDWVAQVSLALDWPYVKNHWLQPWFGYLYVHLPNIWLDSNPPRLRRSQRLTRLQQPAGSAHEPPWPT